MADLFGGVGRGRGDGFTRWSWGVLPFAVLMVLATGGSWHQSAVGTTAPSLPEPAAAFPGTGPGPCGALRSPGWVAAENARPGSAIALPTGSIDGTLGYLDQSSATCGETVTAHLAGGQGRSSRTVRLAAYQIGSYAGRGARLVWQSAQLSAAAGSTPAGAALPHLVTPSWPTTVPIPITGDWPPGFYLLLPVRADGRPVGSAIPFVVRDDAGRAPLLFMASTLTWNAYNDWGGWSLYHGPGGTTPRSVADRARVVALQRPLTGSGYQQMAHMDLPVVRQLEQFATLSGLDVAYTTDVAVHARPAQIVEHNELVVGGHSEYWTTAMYDGLRAGLAAGTNAVFLGANNLWWHTRLEGGTAANPSRELVYRVLRDDPAAIADPASATVQWQTAPLSRDPAAILGQSHAAVGVDGSLQLLDPPAWYTAGTGVGSGSVLKDVVGNEADGFAVRARNPAHTQIFAAGVLTGARGTLAVTTSYSTQPSGAAVFAAGNTDWACLATNSCADLTVSAATSAVVAQLTRNVLLALAAPRAGLTHPATATRPLTVDVLRHRLSPAATGGYGGTEAG